MVSQREIIEYIREEWLQTNQKSKETINKLLELLSYNLYSKENHFILELIQNADDNSYKDSVTALLKFSIDREKILIQNNEKGFTEVNVRDLCNVCESKKSKAFGYIGEKGIGFKSVFRVSNEPQIFSNGFYFKFKHKDEHDKLGFIVPYWIDEVPGYIDEKLTNIVLPLRDEVKEELSKFNEIEPTLLLFLRKLKRIEIHNNIENKTNIWIKQERSGKVEIKHSNKHSKGKERWKLVRESLRVPKYIQEEKRKDVRETELVLTFPLKPDGSADTTKKQKVFAFLPTRLYGFKFIIQADFLVTASREDIDKDKEWNKWLRDNIASVFLKAVEEFKQDEELKKTFYNYIPIADEVNDPFFSSVVEQIHSALREAQCILTESGNWLKPADVFIADGDGIRKLISNDDLKRLHGKEYVSKK